MCASPGYDSGHGKGERESPPGAGKRAGSGWTGSMGSLARPRNQGNGGGCNKKLKRKNVTDFQKAEIFAMAPDSMAPERRSANSAIF